MHLSTTTKALLVFGAFLVLFALAVQAQSNLPDWAFCTDSSQCADRCCSRQYSNDGRLKCTPGGSPDQCVHNQGGKGASWAGSNLYYAAGLNSAQQNYLFSNLRKAGVKVLRVWLDGQTQGSTKGTSPFRAYPDLEPFSVGSYDDTVLHFLDEVMLTAHAYGIKLLISMHSFNALQAGDVYGRRWGTGYFYEKADAIAAFDNRLRHVLNHMHPSLGLPWKSLSQYIFAFEAQNEAMIGNGPTYIANHQYWQCDRAATIKSELGVNPGILVTTGGESWMAESLQPDWFGCDALDILAIHAYGPGDLATSAIQPFVNKAVAVGKRLIVEEWGACYFSTSNNDCPQGSALPSWQRDQNIRTWANAISSAGVPWMYWQVLPNADPHDSYDYEIGINDVNWSTFAQVANETSSYRSAWDWSPYLLY